MLGMKQILKGEILKGHLELLILSAVRQGPLHGYAIVEAIRADSGGTFDLPEGTLYPALHRLEASGVLKSEWDLQSGRQRRIYRLTRQGNAAFRDQVKVWEEFVRSMEAVIRGNNAG